MRVISEWMKPTAAAAAAGGISPSPAAAAGLGAGEAVLHVAAETAEEAMAAVREAVLRGQQGEGGLLAAEEEEADELSCRALVFLSYAPLRIKISARPGDFAQASAGTTAVVLKDVSRADVVLFRRIQGRVADALGSRCRSRGAADGVGGRHLGAPREDDLDDLSAELWDEEEHELGAQELQAEAAALLKAAAGEEEEAVGDARGGSPSWRQDFREEAARTLARRASASPTFATALRSAVAVAAAASPAAAAALLDRLLGANARTELAFPVAAALRLALSSSPGSCPEVAAELRRLLAAERRRPLPGLVLAELEAAAAAAAAGEEGLQADAKQRRPAPATAWQHVDRALAG